MDLSVRQIGLDALRQLGQYPELGQLPNFDKRLEQFRKRFEDDEFRIAVIGEFSSGKSTFINALIGRDLLSHASSETTAAITRLVNVGSGDPRCGRCQVKLRSGKVIQLNDLDQLRDYTTAQSQRFQVVQEVESVELWLPFLPETSRPIVIVDTPGLNGIAEGHQEQTLELVGQAHACIFLLPRRGLDEVSLGFLRLLTNIQCNFIFVQNFIDDLSAAEGDTLEQVLVKQTKILNETFFGEDGARSARATGQLRYRICGVSALQALAARDTGIATLYRGSAQRLDDKTRAKLYRASLFGEFLDMLGNDLRGDQLALLQYGDTAQALCRWLEQLEEYLSQEEQRARKASAYGAGSRELERLARLEQRVNDQKDEHEQKLKNFVAARGRELCKEEKEQVHTRLQAILEELSRTADEKQTKEALDKWSKSLPDEVENRLNEQVLLLNESWSCKLHILWQLLLQRIREYSDIDSVNLNLEMPQVDTSGPKLGWFGKEDEINQLKAQRDRWQKQADEADDEAERNQYNYEREQRNAQDKQRQYEKKKADADYRQRNLGSRPAPEYSTYTEKVYRGGLGFLDALLGPKLVTKTRRDDSRGEAWDRECKELNEMRGQEKVLRDQADAARRAAQRYQEKGSEALKRRQTYLERAKGIERDLNDLMERRKMYEENARREFVRMLRKKICEQIQTYLFGEDGAQQRIEDWMEDRLKRETKTLEEQAIEQFRIAMDCKLKWIAAVREKRTPEIMRQAQNLAKTCEALQVQRQKLEEVLK